MNTKIEEVAKAIFFSNAKNGKIETSFGKKTLTGTIEMIKNAIEEDIKNDKKTIKKIN